MISNTGTWMQSVAMSWLVIKITGSGVDLGLVAAAQFLPVLVLGTFSGLVVDRFPRRRILVVTQTLFLIQASALFLITYTGVVRLWMIFALSLFFGLVNSVDPTARQSFVEQMAGRESLQNAVSLNSVIFNASRAVGPAIAGLLILTVGLAYAFLVNAVSYLAVIIALLALDSKAFFPYSPQARKKGQIREGLSYVRGSPILRTTLITVFIIGTLAYNFNVTLPLLVRFTFHGGAGAFGLVSSSVGLGAIVGGLWVAGASNVTLPRLAKNGLYFGVTMAIAAVMPSLLLTLVALAVMGAFSLAFISQANTALQLNSPPEMRGRIMALYSVGFLGSTPVGAPIVGWIAQHAGPRYALGVGAASILFASGLIYLQAMRRRVHERSATEALKAEAPVI